MNVSADAVGVFSALGLSSGYSPSSFIREFLRDAGLPSPSDVMSDDSTFFDDLSCPSLESRDSTTCSDTSYQRACSEFRHEVLFSDVEVGVAPELHLDDSHDFEDIGDITDDVPITRSPREVPYKIGNFMESNYYKKYLAPDVRERIYITSRRRGSTFLSRFRVPLSVVDTLTDLVFENDGVKETNRVKGHKLYVRTQLLILSSLEHLGGRKPFLQFKDDTEMCEAMHSTFFRFVFLEVMFSLRDVYIHLPRDMNELLNVLDVYAGSGLPGCTGSIDVVHCKWSNCPAGDAVKATGKEKFPSLAFECVTDNRRRVLGVAPVQFGARNDQHIVRLDPTVKQIRKEWYKDVEWSYFDIEGNELSSKGLYLICDGGYLRWRTLICPYQYSREGTQQGYFSANLESVRKDVECTFGILKKRWRILEYGLHYRDHDRCEKIFVVCCILHNIMLDNSSDESMGEVRVGRGAPLPGDAIYLEGESDRRERETWTGHNVRAEKEEAKDWMSRRDNLAVHLAYTKTAST